MQHRCAFRVYYSLSIGGSSPPTPVREVLPGRPDACPSHGRWGKHLPLTRRAWNHVSFLLSSLARRPTLTFIIRVKRGRPCMLQGRGARTDEGQAPAVTGGAVQTPCPAGWPCHIVSVCTMRNADTVQTGTHWPLPGHRTPIVTETRLHFAGSVAV